jgi:hypothetical protein
LAAWKTARARSRYRAFHAASAIEAIGFHASEPIVAAKPTNSSSWR